MMKRVRTVTELLRRRAISRLVILAACCMARTHQEGNSYLRELTYRENPELSAVVRLYGNDSLKRRAAEYLIDNMPYHQGIDSGQMKAMYKAYELFGTGRLTYREALDSAYSLYGTDDVGHLRWREDVLMRPSYLVANIDWAFKVWREQPWGCKVPFVQFCEYVLPYRLGNEELMPWREKLYYRFMPIIERYRNDPRISSPTFAASVVLDSMLREPYYFTGQLGTDIRVGPRITDWRGGSCLDLCDMLVYIYRALGIPCGIDEMPVRGNNNAPHFWNFIEDEAGKTWYFSMFYGRNRLSPAEEYSEPYGKIFRHRFSVNDSLRALVASDAPRMHPAFVAPHYDDVTRIYAGNRALRLSFGADALLHEVDRSEPLYLCMSRRFSWKPVACSWWHADSLVFEDCHGGTVYCLARYDADHDEVQVVSHPFSVDEVSGRMHSYKPDSVGHDLTLLSKFGMIGEFYLERMRGGVFLGSNMADFRHADTLYIIKETPERLFTTVLLDTDRRYRYIRYVSPPGGYCNVAELAFYGAISDTIPLCGEVMGPADGMNGDHGFTNVFDGNTETSFDYVRADSGWVGLDLGIRRRVAKISYAPRNRDNFVRPGHRYELLACLDGRWASLGCRVAAADSLCFDDVPRNTLLLLHHLSGGTAERLFEYKAGRQVFW